MMDLLPIYWLPILAGMMAAINLSQLGIHLATRDRAMQTLCISQGATFGVLLGMGLIPFITDSHMAVHFGPIVFAMASASATSFYGDWIGNTHSTSRNTYFTALFAVLLGAGYLVTALFPSLENHLTQVFFGDLATLSNPESILVLAVSVLGSAALFVHWRAFTNASFEVAAFGSEMSPRLRTKFQWLCLISIGISVQYLGLLFTLTLLFLPTVLLRRAHSPKLKSHLIRVPIFAALSTVAGFLLSLHFTRLPTVPTISLTLFALGLLTLVRLVPQRRPAV